VQWYARAFWNVRWVDDARSLYQQDAVIAAIQQRRGLVPIADTTNFAWHTVCELWPNQDYSGNAEVLAAFAPHRPPTLPGWWNFSVDEPYLVYATPEGPYAMAPVWGRFSRLFHQEHWWGRYYAKQLNNKGYTIKPFIQSQVACAPPARAWLIIE
jgi:hypothetical protein